MAGENRHRRLIWELIKVAIIFGLFWLSGRFYSPEKSIWWVFPSEKFTLFDFLAFLLIFKWFLQPDLERWIKDLIKQAMEEEQIEGEKHRSERS
jgi:hypothetical protein